MRGEVRAGVHAWSGGCRKGVLHGRRASRGGTGWRDRATERPLLLPCAPAPCRGSCRPCGARRPRQTPCALPPPPCGGRAGGARGSGGGARDTRGMRWGGRTHQWAAAGSAAALLTAPPSGPHQAAQHLVLLPHFSTSALSASATRKTSSPVRGSSTGKVLPLSASTHSPPMNSCGRGEAGRGVRGGGWDRNGR